MTKFKLHRIGAYYSIISSVLPPYSIVIFLRSYIKGGITIQERKIYYNQKYVIDKIHNDTGCSIREISNVLNSLRNLVKDKLSDRNINSEIKIFPGLKVTSKYISTEQSKLNLCKNGTINSGYLLYLNGEFSNRFKNEIKQIHDNK